jgi:hypothetical protein
MAHWQQAFVKVEEIYPKIMIKYSITNTWTGNMLFIIFYASYIQYCELYTLYTFIWLAVQWILLHQHHHKVVSNVLHYESDITRQQEFFSSTVLLWDHCHLYHLHWPKHGCATCGCTYICSCVASSSVMRIIATKPILHC